MLTGSDFPSTVRVDLAIKFSEGLRAKEDPSYLNLIEIVPTTSNSKQEVFYGELARLRRWNSGERKPKDFEEYKQNMTTQRWELTHEVKRDDLNRDQSPQKLLMKKAQDFGHAVALSKQIEFWDYLHNGSSVVGYDKEMFYGFNHRYVNSRGVSNSAVAAQSNMHLGGSQLDATTLQLERQHYTNILTDKNQKFGLRLTDVVVYDGSQNHKVAMELNNSQYTVEASTVKGQFTENVFKGSFNIIPTVYGLGMTEWISFALNIPEMKPVKVLSETVNPGFDNFEFKAIGLEQESEGSFWRNDVSFGVLGFFDYNPGYWQTSRLHGSSAYVYAVDDLDSQRVSYPNV